MFCLGVAACSDNKAGSPDTLRPPDTITPADQAADAALPFPFSPPDLTLSQLSCLSFGLNTGSSSSSANRRKVDLALITSLGVGLLRHDFLWHSIEKTKGSFDFSGYDLRVDAAAAAGVKHIGLLAYGNPWATTKTKDDPKYPPDDPADFGRYAKAVVSHYKGKIRLYEVWNEPNAGYRFWKSNPLGDPKAFGALLKAAYKAAKEADPSATVLFGGPFFHDQIIPGHLKFLGDVYKAHPDLGKYYDAMAIHPYGMYPPNAPPELDYGQEEPVHEMMRSLRQLMAQHGDGAKPIYTTEYGWPVWKAVTELQQAQYLVRAYLLLTAAGSHSNCWYTLRDSGVPPTNTEATFGLLAYDSNPTDTTPSRAKPAFTAYQALLSTLGQYKVVQDLRQSLALAPSVFALRLQHETTKRRATALWSTGSTAVNVDLLVSGGVNQLTRVDMLGSQAKLSPGSGVVRVSVGPSPIYVLE